MKLLEIEFISETDLTEGSSRQEPLLFPAKQLSKWSKVIHVATVNCEESRDHKLQIRIPYSMGCVRRLYRIINHFQDLPELPERHESIRIIPCSFSHNSDLRSQVPGFLVDILDEILDRGATEADGFRELCNWCEFLNQFEMTLLFDICCAYISLLIHSNPLLFISEK